MKKLTLAVALSLFLSACGDKAPAQEQTKSAPQPITHASGVLTAASAGEYTLTLDGKTYNTEQANVDYEGQDFNLDSVHKGMNVTLTIQGKNVTDIELDPAFSGLAVLNNDNQLVMNGTKVTITDPEVFSLDYKNGGGDLGWVLVSAHLDNNKWVVTNVSPVNNMPNSEVEGKVSDLTDSSFMLGTTKVVYQANTITDSKKLTNGMYVQAIGVFDNDTLTVNRIDVK
ncbi:DUF5666 domain-containing protein [Photobacterium damselae]|uniref:DUF5666 domain-containing protein n=1 Tax=Photobacterium damselae TaxID=38293 RepID=A0ABD6X5S8_PHODM|nr:DUF5666 domain-containing protein [Photobacterium damselae]OBU46451.1 hypothetical protein AYY27_02355 [Photobacterium damselae]PSU17817.1 hypothetical protein CTM90_04760 [Photobacterium damselae]